MKLVDGARRVKSEACPINSNGNHEWVKDEELSSDGTYGYKCECGAKSKLRFTLPLPEQVEEFEREL
jgi:hypothetical protein